MTTTEGHFCGPEPCPECGEVHGCVCGNCMTTTDPRARLNGIKALAEEYRPTMDIEVVHDWAGEAVKNTFDAEAALTEVLNLHKPQTIGQIYGTLKYPSDPLLCPTCIVTGGDEWEFMEYPCPTVRAITEKLGR